MANWRLAIHSTMAALGINIVIAATQANASNLSKLIELVESKGWKIDLERICSRFGIASDQTGSDGCRLTQLSVQDTEGRGDPHGFNVPERRDGALPYVLMFHLGPLVGEFFLVSAEGKLLKALYRAKGRDYEELRLEDVKSEFEADLAFWTNNISRLEALTESTPRPR